MRGSVSPLPHAGCAQPSIVAGVRKHGADTRLRHIRRSVPRILVLRLPSLATRGTGAAAWRPRLAPPGFMCRLCHLHPTSDWGDGTKRETDGAILKSFGRGADGARLAPATPSSPRSHGRSGPCVACGPTRGRQLRPSRNPAAVPPPHFRVLLAGRWVLEGFQRGLGGARGTPMARALPRLCLADAEVVDRGKRAASRWRSLRAQALCIAGEPARSARATRADAFGEDFGIQTGSLHHDRERCHGSASNGGALASSRRHRPLTFRGGVTWDRTAAEGCGRFRALWAPVSSLGGRSRTARPRDGLTRSGSRKRPF